MLFRSQLADALVVRGDEYLYRGNRIEALERYGRALALDPFAQAAVDRYVFISMQLHTNGALARGIGVATRYLKARPYDAAVRSDRALCYLHLRDYALARIDFQRAASASRDPRDYVFAGWAARFAGDPRSAVALWHAALALHPGYVPANVALMELRQ
jgi:tetratricopeptide (TPR) repeat protein